MKLRPQRCESVLFHALRFLAAVCFYIESTPCSYTKCFMLLTLARSLHQMRVFFITLVLQQCESSLSSSLASLTPCLYTSLHGIASRLAADSFEEFRQQQASDEMKRCRPLHASDQHLILRLRSDDVFTSLLSASCSLLPATADWFIEFL